MNHTVVAILQNQWFPARSVEGVKRAYRLYGTTPADRAHVNALYLFFRCQTGQRLRSTFSTALIELIQWENSTPEIGTEASSNPGGDPKWVAQVLKEHGATVVLAFGKVAQAAVAASGWTGSLIRGPHPAARHRTVLQELRGMAAALQDQVGMEIA